jgi:hypothetical protein
MVNSSKTEFLLIYKNPVCTRRETHYITTTKTKRLMLFREKIVVYFENHIKHINSMGKMQSSSMLKQVVHVVITGL